MAGGESTTFHLPAYYRDEIEMVRLSQPVGKHSVISVASGPSDASGVVTFTVKDATLESVTYTAVDASDGITIAQTVTIARRRRRAGVRCGR